MVGSIEEKAQYKKVMIPYLITVVKLIANLISNMNL